MSAQNLKAVATGAATPEQAKSPYEGLKRQLEASKGEFAPLLGAANVDRFIRVVLNAVLATPELLAADRRTLVASCMKAAQDGLLPDGREAVLNIYSTKVKKDGREEWIKAVQYLPMVQGLVKKLYESGEVTYIDAACVFQADRFVWRRGDEVKLEHEPSLADDPGPIVAAYAVVKLKSGEVKREVMPKRDIEAVRSVSKAQSDSSPWAKWPDQMAIKSVLKRIHKQLPRADAFEQVERSDNEAAQLVVASSVADIAAREPAPPAPAAAPEPAPPALEHTPPDPIEPPAQEPQREPVPAGQASPPADWVDPDSGEQRVTPRPAPHKKPPAPASAKTYAHFADQVQKATDRDIADLVMDEARSTLSKDLYTELGAVYRRTWEGK